jgi:hypothetical protein
MTGTANERNGQCKALAAALDQERAKSRQQAETIATLRDAMGHAMSSLGAACFPDSGVANAYNWLNSALNRTKEQ